MLHDDIHQTGRLNNNKHGKFRENLHLVFACAVEKLYVGEVHSSAFLCQLISRENG